MKAFFAKFSKAIAALGGGGIGVLIKVGLTISGHPPTEALADSLPLVGTVIATVLAPANQ